MRSAPLIIGAFIITPILGAVVGSSMNTNLVQNDGSVAAAPKAQPVGGKAKASRLAQSDQSDDTLDDRLADREDSFAMDTPDGPVELAELRTNGVGRTRRDYALQLGERALEPMSDAEVERILDEALEPLSDGDMPYQTGRSRSAALAAAEAARNAIASSSRARLRSRNAPSSSRAERPYPALEQAPAARGGAPSGDGYSAQSQLDPIY